MHKRCAAKQLKADMNSLQPQDMKNTGIFGLRNNLILTHKNNLILVQTSSLFHF